VRTTGKLYGDSAFDLARNPYNGAWCIRSSGMDFGSFISWCQLPKKKLISSPIEVIFIPADLLRFAAAFVCLAVLALPLSSTARASDENNLKTALLLADILRAARTEIASQQPTINNELVGDKGLTGDVIQDRVLARLEDAGKSESLTNPIDDREAQLIQAQLDSIQEIIDENQPLLNSKGIGFKGFVPAVFAQLTNERFGEKVGDIAEIKVTAPLELVRNRKARPDKWERDVIETRFKADSWSRGELFAEDAEGKRGSAFRVMVPEYYGEACLACHGAPKGEVDITGYPKEGGHAGDLGGSISITLYE